MLSIGSCYKVTRRGLKQFINRQRLAIAHDAPLKEALLILDDCFENTQALDNSQWKEKRQSKILIDCIKYSFNPVILLTERELKAECTV